MALPGPCCFLQSSLSCPGLLRPCGEPGGPPPPPLPPRAFLSSAVYTTQSGDCGGTRPELVIREGLGDAGGRARPIAGGVGVILRAWGGVQALLVPVLFAAAGSPSTLPLPFPPFLSVFLPRSSSLPVPVIRPPGLASAAAPGMGKEPAQHPAQHPAARGRVLAPCFWGSRTPRPDEGCRWQKGKILQSL